jgi:hypothetical protein
VKDESQNKDQGKTDQTKAFGTKHHMPFISGEWPQPQ